MEKRYTDEDNRGASAPAKKYTGAAFLTSADVKMQSRKAIERDIVKHLARAFNLNLKAIGEAVRQETGQFDYLMLGVNQAYCPRFPADILVAAPKRGAGQAFTLNRLLRCPEKYSLVGHFLKMSENLQRNKRPAMLAGLHPRLGLLAVTNLKMEADLLCFQFSISLGKGEQTQTQTLVIAEIKRLLCALHRQGIWAPEAVD